LLPETETPRRVEFKRGGLWEFVSDNKTRYVDLEGAIRSGKTTACLWKIIHSCTSTPGINWLICRYSDAETKTKLQPRFLELCADAGVLPIWNATEKAFDFANGARVYCFGIKAQDKASRYAKFRGMTLASIYVDQAEELPLDVYEDLKGRLSQPGKPQQLILSPNPPSDDHWISNEFPTGNNHRGFMYYRVSLYDNAHNLDPETIQSLEAAYPVGHAKHGPMLLGLRGVNISGLAVYGPLNIHEPETAAFQRTKHERAIAYDPTYPLYEAIDFGKHHPCVVWAQYNAWGDLHVLGGLLGQQLYLKDFAKLVLQYRVRWFPEAIQTVTCCDPAGSHDNSQGSVENGVSMLGDLGIVTTYRTDSNTPSVRLSMIERIAGHMRERSPAGESFGVDNSRWLRISASSMTPHRFVADALEAGYVWDEHVISVANKPMRRPRKDGWYEHGMNCLEYLEHNFGGVQPTMEQSQRRAASLRAVPVRQYDKDPFDERRLRAARAAGRGRGGY
jgi:PBSX family phage terminase large subunit